MVVDEVKRQTLEEAEQAVRDAMRNAQGAIDIVDLQERVADEADAEDVVRAVLQLLSTGELVLDDEMLITLAPLQEDEPAPGN